MPELFIFFLAGDPTEKTETGLVERRSDGVAAAGPVRTPPCARSAPPPVRRRNLRNRREWVAHAVPAVGLGPAVCLGPWARMRARRMPSGYDVREDGELRPRVEVGLCRVWSAWRYESSTFARRYRGGQYLSLVWMPCLVGWPSLVWGLHLVRLLRNRRTPATKHHCGLDFSASAISHPRQAFQSLDDHFFI